MKFLCERASLPSAANLAVLLATLDPRLFEMLRNSSDFQVELSSDWSLQVAAQKVIADHVRGRHMKFSH
jgi:hypothetical protein